MNPTIDLLMQRKSVRAYTDQPIPAAEKETILQAALRAPTAGNMMLYSIIEVSDPQKKERLVETCDNQPFIAKAPLVLIFLADYQRWYDYYLAGGVVELCRERDIPLRSPQEGDLLLACCDALIAAHSAVVAAESLGIGSCYIGDIIENYEIHQAMFDLPQYALPVAMVVFGYPTHGQLNRPLTPRFAARHVVHQDAYRRLPAEELEAMFAERNAQLTANPARLPTGVHNIGQFNYLRKFSAEFSLEMTRSVRAMLRRWTAPTE